MDVSEEGSPSRRAFLRAFDDAHLLSPQHAHINKHFPASHPFLRNRSTVRPPPSRTGVFRPPFLKRKWGIPPFALVLATGPLLRGLRPPRERSCIQSNWLTIFSGNTRVLFPGLMVRRIFP